MADVSAVDPPDSSRQPHQPGSRRRQWLVVALALVLVGAFTVSASSTWLLGDRHHLGELARTALILMLEVGNVAGASIYVATKRKGVRVRAGLVVGICTTVAGTGGVQAYGFLIGLAVAALLLLLVDTIAHYWDETTSTDTSETSTDSAGGGEGFAGPEAVEVGPTEPGSEPGPNGRPLPAEPPELPEPRPAPNDLPHPDDEPDEDDSAAADEPAPLPEVRGVEPRIVAQAAELLEREPQTGRPTLRAYCGLTDHKAGLVLAALRPRPLAAVGSEAS